jgi:hypothetical protein
LPRLLLNQLFYLEVRWMATKKLTFVVEMTEEEAERFERYIEEGCYDRGKLVGKWINGLLDKKEHWDRLSGRRGVNKAV